ncbi:ClpP/crotonase-like domain-containing protein [Blastocladiella britannica]|nr:ClpP/crotonase-like domain-containing protein [Blastocladiella britannica]
MTANKNNMPPTGYKYSTLKTSSTDSGRVRVICFSRPDKFNALSALAYKEWLWALNAAAADPAVVACVVTGAGPYYSSGNELAIPTPAQFAAIGYIREYLDAHPGARSLDPGVIPSPPSDAEIDLDILERGRITRDLISAMIHFPKLLVAGVNGPAIGFAVTTLALFDFVYAAPTATFMVPFMQWAFCAEGCSSVTFPKILGPALANQMLYLGKKATATDLTGSGFITEIVPAATFQRDVIAKTVAMAKALPPIAFQRTKALVKAASAPDLEAANQREMNELIARMASEECETRVAQFFTKKAAAAGKNKAKL